MRLLFTLCVALFVSMLSGCGGEAESSGKPAPAALPDGLFVSDAPTVAVEVVAAKANDAGAEVVVRGVVAGGREPVSENRALFTLLDSSIRTCDQLPGDACRTPWDACCETSDTIAAHALPIRVVDSSGQPLRVGLRDRIAPLSVVTVDGTLRRGSDGTPVLDARAIHVGVRR